MQKSHKQEMLALLATMGKMAELLPKMQDTSEQIQDLLAACECLRENLEGEDAPECLSLLQSIDVHNHSALPMRIKKMESVFKSEVKTKKEVVFLPYKASMWDSLESIYLAAKADSDCDAFVMPIPYCDKKDGRLTEMHWETEYSKNIPLIDYRKYDIAERRPDMIFIHNPYDDLNIVTSVHPDFYSERLRNFTNCLVYVPYFVGNGTHVTPHFCTVPGCLFAHKVIVQTEREREIYVSEYKKATRESGSKFLALGSPKLDKAISAKREDFEIPAEWEKLINGKKVIFYGLSIGALLTYSVEGNKPSNKYLQKVRSVFEFFKNRDDAVLLWRPHPLLEGTIKSMRPWLEQEYAEIVNEYKSGGYGIYDDSQDLNRAVALSDMYYGDGSSVMSLFTATGKAVLGQLFDFPYYHGILDDGNFIWFMDFQNVLYRHNKENKNTECIGMIAIQNASAYLNIVANNEKLYFAPYYKNNKIVFFDTDKNMFEQIDFKDDCKYDRKYNIAVSFKKFIYFIPHDFPAIMKLNANTNEIEYFSMWMDDVSKLQVSKLQHEVWKDTRFFGFCVVGTEIALVIHKANAVMFFNMESDNYKIKKIGEKSERYHGICFDGQDYYIASYHESYVVKWNRESNVFSKINIPSFSRKENIHANFLIQYLNGYVWLLPIGANNAYKIDINTNRITELPELTEYLDKSLDWNYNLVSASENSIYASTLNKGIVEYNTNTSELSFIKPSGTEMETVLPYYISNCKNKLNEIATKTETAGKVIYETLRASLKTSP